MKRITMSLLLLLIGISTKADTIWDISGQITSNGNNNSSVTVDYSYMMDVGASNFGPTYAMSESSATGTGSLGSSFTLGNYNTSGYVPIFDSEGDEIDLLTGVNGVVPFLAEWWKCQLACIADFMPAGSSLPVYYNAGGNWGAAPFTMTQMETINGVSASASDAINPPPPPDPPATPTPEPPAAIMLLCGIVALGVYSRRHVRT